VAIINQIVLLITRKRLLARIKVHNKTIKIIGSLTLTTKKKIYNTQQRHIT